MAIRFTCACGQKLKTGDETVGKRAKCPKCAKWLVVPQSDSYTTVATEAPAKSATPEVPVKPPTKTAGALAASVAAASAALKPAAASARAPGSPATGATAAPIGRVVVADSNPEDLKKTALLLRNHNYTVLEATDGQRAVDVARGAKPDAVVVNIRMEGMSGFQVIQHVRDPANPLNKDIWAIPILMTAEKLNGRDKQYAMSLGVDGYFVKPLNAALLCAKLEKEITKYRSRT
jgi:CheY-like chemotaxis protein